jgi:hypothetical protein
MPNGAAIASSYADLVAGSGIDTALNTTELGGQVTSSAVWTNTRHDGTPGGSLPLGEYECPNYPLNDHCANWGSSAGNGSYALNQATNCVWTAFSRGLCSSTNNRLYCFQQR